MTNDRTGTERSVVSIPIDLGWRFAELYDAERLPGPRGKQPALPE